MTMNDVPVDVVNARRIGVISDTHWNFPNVPLPDVLPAALEGVDLIVHCGHIGATEALDRLEQVAPVLAVRTDLDDSLFGDALVGEMQRGRINGFLRVLDAGGARIGVVHDFGARGIEVPAIEEGGYTFPVVPMAEVVASKFGQPLDLVLVAATHIPMVLHRQGVLLVNPGSPNLPGGRRKGGLGTAAILDVDGSTVGVEIVDLAAR